MFNAILYSSVKLTWASYLNLMIKRDRHLKLRHQLLLRKLFKWAIVQ